ncbi:MAG: hypothetical protein CL557_17645 [Alphaproteobacteria bacterium]|nr:hypothetical protein [Alphaproteobacteria bacterium]|tara:strand:- start:1466 stop:2206 length:741 start_codon:yes stop_codon:yes gene_type:complete
MTAKPADAANALIAALCKFSASVPPIPKNGEGQFGAYPLLDDILRIVTPELARNGLFLNTTSSTEDGAPQLITRVHHVSGEFFESKTRLIVAPGRNPVHQAMSAVTQQRRYEILNILGITGTNDDDGAAAAGATPEALPQSHAPAQSKPSAPQPAQANEGHSSNSSLMKTQTLDQLLAWVKVCAANNRQSLVEELMAIFKAAHPRPNWPAQGFWASVINTPAESKTVLDFIAANPAQDAQWTPGGL